MFDDKKKFDTEISVVIPSYNEKANIKPMLEQVHAALEGVSFEVIYIDDSTDDTPEELERMAAVFPALRFEHRTNKTGLSSAVIRGFELARGRYIAVMDADLQHPPILLCAMYAAVKNGADMCIPSRHIPGGSDGEFALHRRFVSWTARTMGKVAVRGLRQISDPTGGVFMFRASCFDGDYSALGDLGWKIMIEVLASGRITTVVEVPYTFNIRVAGESKLSQSATLDYLKQLAELHSSKQVGNRLQVDAWSVEKTCAEISKLFSK